MRSQPALFLTCIGAALLCVALGTALSVASHVAGDGPVTKSPPQVLFQGWPDRSPDLALVLSGEQFSYIKFCGCSLPQLGGFERRFNFMAKLKDKGWPTIALDLGDLVAKKTGSVQEQTLIKYKSMMEALNLLGYTAIGVGQNEFNLPLADGVARYTLQKPEAGPRLLAANLNQKYRMDYFGLDDKQSMVGDWIVVREGNRPTLGAVSVVSPGSVQMIHDATLQKQFEQVAGTLNRALAEFDKQQVELRVLLFQGTGPDAGAIAKQFPQFQVILCRSQNEEPSGAPVMVGKTMLIEVGWKGRYVGVVGAFRTRDSNKPFEFRYQLVAMTDEFETDAQKEKDHKIIQLMEDYARQIRDANLLPKFPKAQHPMQVQFPQQQVGFVGSEACKACHPAEYEKWQTTGHSHAYDTLVHKAKKPSLRQFDGECIACHTVGFGFNTGYIDEQRTAHLKNVGCENCHGPGSLHVANPNDKRFLSSQSPWKSQPTDRVMGPNGAYNAEVLKAIDAVCQKCHDVDNDPKFRFEDYWPKIEHGKKTTGAAKK